MKYCYKCGKELKEEDNFCNHCGTEQNIIQKNPVIKKKWNTGNVIIIIIAILIICVIFFKIKAGNDALKEIMDLTFGD